MFSDIKKKNVGIVCLDCIHGPRHYEIRKCYIVPGRMVDMRIHIASLIHKDHNCHGEAPHCIQRCQSAMLGRAFLYLLGVLLRGIRVDQEFIVLIVLNSFPVNS